MKKVWYLVQSFRPRQWVKNFFIFVPMVFSISFVNKVVLLNNLLAFLLFSLVCGCVYIFNDCFDKKKDQVHPKKRFRPIAAEKVSVYLASVSASVVQGLALFVIFMFNKEFFILTLVYIAINFFYSGWLKNIVILDVILIAIGFVLRVLIGGVITGIHPSNWLLIITFVLSMFLGLVKRRQELIRINSLDTSPTTRLTLKKYNTALLDQLISITTATTLISYIIYVLNADILTKFHNAKLYITVPFVVFGLFRYLFLTYTKDMGESPEEIVFWDIPFVINIALWLAIFIVLIY